MKHRSARRLLPDLVDGGLSAADEAGVRAHVDVCTVCGRVLRELETSERLLQRMPAAFLPLDVGPEAERRLRALAHWLPPPAAASWRAPLVGALVAALALLVWSHSLRPLGTGYERPTVEGTRWQVSSLVPIPGAEGVPYSWRQ